MRTFLGRLLRRAASLVDGDRGNLPLYDHPRYRETNRLFLEITRETTHIYAWGVIQGARLARALGIERVSMIEFGVAGGKGLVALERLAKLAGERTGVRIDVYGFDTGVGLPRSRDPRDLPHLLAEGDFPMDLQRLQQRLTHARLLLGPVHETIDRFIASKAPPVAFISFDLDLYSSTRDAFKLLDAEHGRLLPRVYAYFDDIYACGDFDGERLAIAEFNAAREHRKISPIHGLRYLVPARVADWMWGKYHLVYLFDHPLFTRREIDTQASLELDS